MSVRGTDQELKVQDRAVYRSMISWVIYLMTCCRPDIAGSVVGILSTHVECPWKEHMVDVKRLFRSARGQGSWFDSWGRFDLHAGSLWFRLASLPNGQEINNRIYIIRLGAGLISWKRCKQQSVSVSITEAYKALAKCLQEFMWLRQLFHQRKLGVKFPWCPVVVNQDNQSTMHLAKCTGIKNTTKHMDVSYHFIKDLVRDKSVYLKCCPTEDTTADALTEPLGNILFLKHRTGMRWGSIVSKNSDSVAHNQIDWEEVC